MEQRGEKIAMLTAYDYFTAKTLDECGIDVILVGDTVGMAVAGNETTIGVKLNHIIYHAEMVSRAANRAMVVGDMPFLSFQLNIDSAVENAGRLMQEGRVHAVKLEGGRAMVPVIKRILRAGIPVMGHLGLTPQSVHRFGGFRVQGKDPESARRLREAAKALEDAGCFAIVLEAIPAALAADISGALTVPTIGIGAGPHCDGQVLVTPDMLGITGFDAKYLKRYANVGEVIREAVAGYVADVKEQRFPTNAHSYR
ncbi:MAG TPA: 3-methyl-2-oxobutanoate hydroxymethyltransferase [Planctomycetaceae bacterium]|nr:3-methyl-2-oxobutanoate hydroxymethyltransferase [Planctomycetaceae bacterium]